MSLKRGLALSFLLLGSSLASVALHAPPARSVGEAKYVGSDACRDCHEDQFKDFQGSPHGRAQMDKGLLAGEAGCESCHGPGSLHVNAGGEKSDPGFATIRKPSQMKAGDADAICQGCHTGGDQFYWKHSSHSRKGVSCVSCHSIHHPKSAGGAKLLSETSANALCLRCHTDQRHSIAKSGHMPVREGGMACSDCHNPHGTAAPKMIRAATVNDLCYKCHADKRGPFLWEHAPVRENCITCHQPHGSNNDKVLAGKRPYLCQRCHVASRHPSTLYDYPDLVGNRLFNRSCTNCHSQVHGSNHPSGKYLMR
jgi:DmsE family decaheme c-type cytochrome